MCYEKYLSDSVLRQQTTRKRWLRSDLCPAHSQRQKHLRIVASDHPTPALGFRGEQGCREEYRGQADQC